MNIIRKKYLFTCFCLVRQHVEVKDRQRLLLTAQCFLHRIEMEADSKQGAKTVGYLCCYTNTFPAQL